MERLLKSERRKLFQLVSKLYPDKYVRITKKGNVVFKEHWYSWRATVITFKSIITDVIPRSFASLFDNPRETLENYSENINFPKNKGFGAITYLYEEYFNNILSNDIKGIDLDKGDVEILPNCILLKSKSKPLTVENQYSKKIKALPVKEPSQILIPFMDLIEKEPTMKVMAVVTTGDPEWDKELEKVIRPKRLNFKKFGFF